VLFVSDPKKLKLENPNGSPISSPFEILNAKSKEATP